MAGAQPPIHLTPVITDPAVAEQWFHQFEDAGRHTNLLERTFGESRRRVKVIGRLPGEHSCLSLVWAVLDRASVGWRGIDTSVAGIRRLQDLRRQLLAPGQLAVAG